MKMNNLLLTSLAVLLACASIKAQYCDPSTPVLSVDLTGQPNGTWISPPTARLGYCCGLNSGPDQCIQFNLTLDTAAIAISFDIYSGAVPGGSMFFQVNCGPMQAVGQPVCLTGAGPHIITFCKPGNNANQYAITSISDPALEGTRYVSQSCQGLMVASGLTESTIQWTSIPPNATYNSYLSCTSGCDSVTITPPLNFAGYIDYQVCGSVVGGCAVLPFCDTIRVTFVNNLSVNITPVNPTICFGGSNVTVTANGVGGLPPYNYLWSTGQTSASITVGQGTYHVTLTDQMNCYVASDSVVVNALNSPISCDAGPDSTLCLNDLAYQLNGSVIAATGGLWSGGGTFVPSPTTLNALYYPSPQEISAGYATLRLITTGNAGCLPDTDFVRISIIPNPMPQIIGSSLACINETGMYGTTLVSGDAFQWSVTGGIILSQSINSVVIKWTSTGNSIISVIETNSAGCDSIAFFNVMVMPKPAPFIMGAATVCNTGIEMYSVQNPVPGSTYQWSVTNGVFIDTSSLPISVFWNVPGTGTVTVTETNAYGCDSSLTIPITIVPQPTPAITGDNVVCNYQTSVYSTPFSVNSQYNWTVNNGSIIMQGGNYIHVHWNTVGTGTISLTEINHSFCDSSVSFSVQILPQPVPVVSGPQTACSRAITTYLVGGVNNNESISWSVYGGMIIGTSTLNAVDVVWFNAGIGQLRVRVVNPSGCDSIAEYQVNIIEGVQPEMKGPDRACENDTCVYTVGNVQGHTYQWQVTGGVLVSGNGNSIKVWWQTAGNGSIRLTETSMVGCDSTVSLMVTVNPLPIATTNGIPNVCEDQAAVFYTNANAGVNYAWSLSGGNILGSSTQTSVSCTWDLPGSYILTLSGMNQHGCVSMASLPIQVLPRPVVTIAGNVSGCINRNSIFTIGVTPGIMYSYSVTGGIITSQSNGQVQIRWTSYGTHSFTAYAVNNQNGCSDQRTLNINVLPLPSPVVNANAFAGCPPMEIAFYNNTDSNQYNYTWSFGDGALSFEPNPTYTYPFSGTFPIKVLVTNNGGCADSAQGIVTIYPSPVSGFYVRGGSRKHYAEFDELQLENTSTGAITWQWDLGNGDITSEYEPSITYSTPGFYDITLETVNSWGCRHSTTRKVEIIVPEHVFIPNAFTPNGDSKNDYFSVRFLNIVEANISIYNRWGELIYHTSDLDFKWDGTCSGRTVQNDVYVYRIAAIGYYGTQIEKVGKITVMH